MPDVSLVATLVGTLLGFGLGALWYGPLFGASWSAAVGHAPDAVRRQVHPASTYGAMFALGFVAAYVFGLFLGPHPGRVFSAVAGAAAGGCWVSTALATNDLFERRRPLLLLINGGYHTLRFVLIGLSFAFLG